MVSIDILEEEFVCVVFRRVCIEALVREPRRPAMQHSTSFDPLVQGGRVRYRLTVLQWEVGCCKLEAAALVVDS